MQGSVVDNRYDVVRPLGSGGMGEVYLARDRTLGRDVAIKILRSQFASDRESAERFKREATSAARLSHPNIVQVYDRGDTEDGSSYIAMEYVPGGTLKDRIIEEGALDPGLAASYGYQVAEALGAAHAKGVVHRDIKPQNVLITASGQAKVADFGIARAASAASAASTTSQTKTGAVMGTAAYMSPEQALGRPATHKSDLYSLGIVLYEAITGTPPFTAGNPIAVSMKHVNEEARPPRELNPGVSAGMNAVVMNLLSKDPVDRYADADALAEDLWRVRQGQAPALAGPDEAETVETPTHRPVPTTRQAAVAPARRKRSPAPFVLAAVLLLLGLLGLGWAFAQGLGGSGGGSGGTVEVPSVEGLSRDQAVSRLESEGFRAEVRAGGSGGEVVRQSPAGGRRAPEGSIVALTVGGGTATVSVPNVLEMGYADAEAELQGAGLSVGSTYDVPSGTAAGVVLEQGVAPGSEVAEGTAVNLGLSTGPAPTTLAPTTPASTTPASTTPASASPDASAGQQPGSDSSVAPDASAGQQPGSDASAAPSSASASAPADGQAGEEAQKRAEERAEEAQKRAEERAEEAQKRAEERAKEAGDEE